MWQQDSIRSCIVDLMVAIDQQPDELQLAYEFSAQLCMAALPIPAVDSYQSELEADCSGTNPALLDKDTEFDRCL